MKKVICMTKSNQDAGLSEFQKKINELQSIKDKLEGKLDSSNAAKVANTTSFFIKEINEMTETYLKTLYDSTL